MNDLETIKSKLDIVDTISSYVSTVQRAGSNFRAVCPFHNEKTPSFMINPSLQIFKCFGCGKGGDVIKFIQEIERVDFVEALKISAQKAGIELSGQYSSVDNKLLAEKKRIVEANLLATKFYNFILKNHQEGESGRNYVKKRQIDKKCVEAFQVGFAPNSSSSLKTFLISKGFNEKELIKFGLLVERNGKIIDKFRNRLLQPIFNVQGDIIAFSGRYVGTSKLAPKYLNSPETIVYKKNEILYGLFQAKESIRKQNFVILVEGNIDILSSHKVGVENIVAPLGTAFTLNQAKLIKRFCDEVFFCFDTDEAGIKALVRGVEIAENAGLKHKVIDIKGYQDADELISKDPDKWPNSVKDAVDSIEYLIKLFSTNLDLSTAQGKIAFRDKIMPALNAVLDPISLNHYIKEIAQMLDVAPAVILSQRNASKKGQSRNTHNKGLVESIKIVDEPKAQIGSIANPRQLKDEFFLAFLIDFSDHKILDQIPNGVFLDDNLNEILKTLKTLDANNDIGQIAESMPESLKSKFSELALFDLPQGKDSKIEFKKLYLIIMKRYYENQIKKIKRELMNNDDDDSSLFKLNELTKLLNKLEKAKLNSTFF